MSTCPCEAPPFPFYKPRERAGVQDQGVERERSCVRLKEEYEKISCNPTATFPDMGAHLFHRCCFHRHVWAPLALSSPPLFFATGSSLLHNPPHKACRRQRRTPPGPRCTIHMGGACLYTTAHRIHRRVEACAPLFFCQCVPCMVIHVLVGQ